MRCRMPRSPYDEREGAERRLRSRKGSVLRGARVGPALSVLAIAGAAFLPVGCAKKSSAEAAPMTPAAASKRSSITSAARGNIDVTLCDGQTTVSMPPGTSGTAVASALMAEWIRKNPNANWAEEERERHKLEPAADNGDVIGQVQGQTYGLVTSQDVALWKSETERAALAGSEVFHSAEALGSTIGVSCDMCHPHAANTHPETYPKYQVQLGRVVLLRDMINWCIEHPVRGKPLASDDPRMRALETYILAQRKGAKLDYGKH